MSLESTKFIVSPSSNINHKWTILQTVILTDDMHIHTRTIQQTTHTHSYTRSHTHTCTHDKHTLKICPHTPHTHTHTPRRLTTHIHTHTHTYAPPDCIHIGNQTDTLWFVNPLIRSLSDATTYNFFNELQISSELSIADCWIDLAYSCRLLGSGSTASFC